MFHLRMRKKDRHITCLKNVYSGWTRRCCRKLDNTALPTGLRLGVGKHKGLCATAKLCRNAIIQRMFLELSDCRSWSNWPCAAKIQNNVCRMVGKIQWDWCHTCSMSRSIPCTGSFSGSTWGSISWTGIPIVRFPEMTRSFFTGCFWFWKSWLRTSTFLAFSFLIFASSFVRVVLFIICTLFWMIGTEFTFRNVVLTFRRNFLAFFTLGPPNTIFFWPPFKVLCLFFAEVCFTSSFESTFAFYLCLYLFPLPFVLLASRLLNWLDCQPCSLSSRSQKHDLSSSI